MHTLVSDLIQPALALTEAAPQDANPAISYATASTGQSTNEANASSTVQLPVVGWGSFDSVEAVIAREATSVDHSLQDDIPTPEQMWGLGGIANAPENFTFIATPPREDSPFGCSPTQRLLPFSHNSERDATGGVAEGTDDSAGFMTPRSVGGTPADRHASSYH